MAGTKDIHGSVATHLRKNMAKRNWRKAFNGKFCGVDQAWIK